MKNSHDSPSGAAFAAVLITSMALGACTEGDGDSAASREGTAFTTEDSAGIAVVDVWEAISPGGDAWRLAPEPSVAIGLGTEEPEYLFTWVVGALRLAPDTIAILDGVSRELRFFDGQGSHLVTTGGRGEGPGEFEQADELSRFAGGVQIKGSEKRVRFSSSGERIADERFDWAFPFGSGCEVTFYGDDVFLCKTVSELGLPPPGVMRTRDYRMLRTRWPGARLDTIGVFTAGGDGYHRGSDGMYHHVFDPFERHDRVAVGGSPPVVAALRHDRYELTFMTAAGDTLRIVRRDGGAMAPSREVLAVFYQRMSDMLINVSPEIVEEYFPAPDSIPKGKSLLVDRSGNTWVGLWQLGAAETGHDTYEVFLANGRLLGEVAVPAGSELMDVGEDYVLLARTDEMDVPFVELYGLLKG